MVLKDIETEEIFVYASGLGYPSIAEGVKRLQEADFVVGHNVIWYDIPVLNLLAKAGLDPYSCIDTLVVSRLMNSWDYSQHSLDNWGERLGYPKAKFNDWSQLTEEMITYCKRDIEVNFKVFKFLEKYIFNESLKRAMRIEHDTAIYYREMHENGFAFDAPKAEKLRTDIQAELDKLDTVIQDVFPPKASFLGEVMPKLTKTGKISVVNFKWMEKSGLDGTPEENGYMANAPFSRLEWVPFNPASPQQIIERMWEFGWSPTEKTKGHIKAERNRDYEKLEKYKIYGWTASEENLKTLPETAPAAAHSLVRWLLLNSRITTLTTWLEAYNPVTKRIHGEVRHIGTWTHRASHKNPNTGNITRVNFSGGEILWGEPGGYGADFRSLWTSSPGWKLVGCDAEGIQLRVLAHYMEDEEFTRALISGSSKDGTDVHSMNRRKLGEDVCKTRDIAKTFIYSWVLGASATKSAQVLSCTVGEATKARKNFLNGYPGLKRVKEELIPADAARGFFEGFDGRLVMCDSEHLMLAGYLQNGENAIMKYANRLWYTELKKLKIPFRLCNMVHDEFQTEVLDEDGMPEIAGKIMAKAIVDAGVELGVKCPQAGTPKVGFNWLDTH